METKPVPLPRQRGQSTPPPIPPLAKSKPKPVPLPRKLATSPKLQPQKAENMGVVTKEGDGNHSAAPAAPDEDDLSSIPDASSFKAPSAKRGTINIFQLANQLDDPFNDFDAEFNANNNVHNNTKEEEEEEEEKVTVPKEEDGGGILLSHISFPSPFRDLDEDTKRRISSCTYSSISSTSTDDSSDHYMEPPPARPIPSELAANLSPGGPASQRSSSSGINRGSRTGSGRSSKLPPLKDDDEEDEEKGSKNKVVNHHHPLEKVVSCPAAPLAHGHADEEYEPVAAASSGSFSLSNRLPSSPCFPSNNNFHDNKRVTVPNVNVFNFNLNEGKDKNSMDRFAQNKLKFESNSSINKNDKVNPSTTTKGLRGRRSIASAISDTESTDSFQFSSSNSDLKLKHSSTTSSHRSSTGSLRQAHEYDDVAIEDGTVVFLDNMENAAALSDETNNNSTNSITSRDSVIAEFDPLNFTVTRRYPAPPPPVPHATHHHSSASPKSMTNGSTSTTTGSASSDQQEIDEEQQPRDSETSCLDLNDGEQHRYEYIDTDAEDGRSSCSNSNNEDSPPGSNQQVQQVDNPTYTFPVDFKANFRKQQPTPEGEEMNEQTGQGLNEDRYEPVGEESNSNSSPSPPPPPPKKPSKFSIMPNLIESPPSSPSPQSSPQPSSSSSSTSSASNSQIIPEPSGGGSGGGNSFFRRFSSKFRLNSIREESPACRKCGSEHGEKERCKFSPPYRESIVFSTNLYKSGGLGRKEWTPRRVVLQPRGVAGKGRLAFFNDKAEMVSEVPLDKIAVISKKESSSSSSTSSSSSQLNLQYFELSLVHWKQNSLVLAAGDESERGKWMSKYIEAHTTSLPPLIRSSFDRGGWVFLKETVASSEWRPGWLLLRDRALIYSYQGGEEYWELDLRKARCIELGGKEEEARCPFVDNGDVLTLDLCARILYIQTESSRHTRDWEKALRTAAAKNGPHFSEMQLTLENVPVVVDKCIDFLYAHGTLAEGIYRQSGSNTRIAQLLADFQKDAWAVTIAPKEFSAHDVAGTLKRFFRTLPEPLVTTQLYPEWIKAAGLSDRGAKEAEYIRLLESLPQLNYNILKKLMCHLYAVHELHEKNLMPLINLAPIWGPTLMSVDGGASGLSYDSACAECEVVKELIEGYYTLFRVEEVERDRERRMHLALENFHLGSLRRKCSGDMKIYIYVWDKDETSAANVALTPYSSAAGIVSQILENSRVRNAENVGLYEVICGGSLERVLHPGEKVIDTVLRWSLWDIEDRKDNFLILKKNTLYPRLVQYAKEPHMVGSEVKVADSKSKSYRKAQLQFSQATLKLFKDIKCNVEQASWKIEEIVWYVGCESRRSPPSKWTFTLAPKTYHLKRSKEESFFGWVIGTQTEEELHRWLGALVVGEHPEGLYPNVML